MSSNRVCHLGTKLLHRRLNFSQELKTMFRILQSLTGQRKFDLTRRIFMIKPQGQYIMHKGFPTSVTTLMVHPMHRHSIIMALRTKLCQLLRRRLTDHTHLRFITVPHFLIKWCLQPLPVIRPTCHLTITKARWLLSIIKALPGTILATWAKEISLVIGWDPEPAASITLVIPRPLATWCMVKDSLSRAHLSSNLPWRARNSSRSMMSRQGVTGITAIEISISRKRIIIRRQTILRALLSSQ